MCVCVFDCESGCGISCLHEGVGVIVLLRLMRYIAVLMHSCMSVLWHQFNGTRTYMCVSVCVRRRERELERGYEIRKERHEEHH